MNELVIDISQHNGYINFERVKHHGVKACIIRVGWIGNKDNHTLDTRFEEYYRLAKEYNIKVGFYVYSYCKTLENLRKGTMWLLDKLENKKADLPIFLDLEDATIAGLGRDVLTEQAENFCRIIENSGYKAGIYASKYWWENNLYASKLLNWKIWLAEWGSKYNHTFKYKVDLWQWTSDGFVDGINGRVDLNKCLCNCLEENENNENQTNGDDVEMKLYQNGSTIEPVYQDILCTKQIGYLHEHEQAECYGIINGVALIVYNKDKKKDDEPQNKKSGFVKWLGGVK